MARGVKIISLWLGLIMAAGCVKSHVNLEDSGLSRSRTLIVGSIGNDEKGLPLFGTPLTERPSKEGEHFAILRLTGDRPTLSCDIVVVGRNPDFHKPIQAVYEWTGKGFRLGLGVTGLMAQLLQGATGPPQVVLVIVFAPIVAGTAGGFVVGVADGIVITTEELGKIVTKDERLITCTSYEYDDLDRLTLMRMFTADRTQELVRTTFEYEGPSRVPTKAVVKSLVEGAEQEVR